MEQYLFMLKRDKDSWQQSEQFFQDELWLVDGYP